MPRMMTILNYFREDDVEYAVISQPREKRVALSGQFTFSDNAKFKQILELLDDAALQNITLDFSEIDFIDSAGLGMLLLIRDECQTRNISLTITGTSGQVHKIFLISKFDQLFTMSGGGHDAIH